MSEINDETTKQTDVQTTDTTKAFDLKTTDAEEKGKQMLKTLSDQLGCTDKWDKDTEIYDKFYE